VAVPLTGVDPTKPRIGVITMIAQILMLAQIIILAQVATYGWVQILIFLIVACGIIGVALVAFRSTGVGIPDWVVKIFWIVAVVVIAVMAIRFLTGMM
jgi:hypothetical protein